MRKLQGRDLAVVLTALTVALIVIAVGLAYANRGIFYPAPAPAPAANQAADGSLIGGDKDAHGCLVAAGYSWCGEKNKCLRSWEEACAPINEELSEADITAIKQALADKYKKKLADVRLTIAQETAGYMRGGVKFQAEGPGAIVLAAKVGNKWVIAFDGNGSISCTEMSKFNFPAAMIADCATPAAKCTCPDGYYLEGEACNPDCYKSAPKCLRPSIQAECTTGEAGATNTGLANPASVYCEEHNGRLEIRTAPDGSQSGSCIFASGKECEEWSYFRGECLP